MKKPLAFVLSGGGARGALQVGALKALLEARILPDILVGTSIGAANAAFLALSGFTSESIDRLVAVWRDTEAADLLPSNYLWLTVRTLFNRRTSDVSHRMQEFFSAHGISPALTFQDVGPIQLRIVATDLNFGRPVVYGDQPHETVLEAVLASAALPPWVNPLHKHDQLLIDGGVVSNLPVEAALEAGAREMIALDLSDPRDVQAEANGFGPFLNKLNLAVERRQLHLELALAEARRVRVRRIELMSEIPVALWDFRCSSDLIACGYALAQAEIARWRQDSPGWRRLARMLRRES